MSMFNQYEFHSVHCCSLATQSNIYGMTNIQMPNGMEKILVASVRGDVMSTCFSSQDGVIAPTSGEIHFSYIPGDAEIISIDAFSKMTHQPGGQSICVAIAFIKMVEEKCTHFLNIYCDWEPSADYNLDSIAQNCDRLSLELSFVPFRLCHVPVMSEESEEMVWLLSGDDNVMHLFREERRSFEERPIQECFCELAELPNSPVTWLDMYHSRSDRRMTAVGCQDGDVVVHVVDGVGKKAVILASHTLKLDSTITHVQFFSLSACLPCPTFLSSEGSTENGAHECSEEESMSKQLSTECHLLVASAVETSLVYKNICEVGLKERESLAGSDKYDTVMCCCVADIDFDGDNELLLGTYGQQILIYKKIEDGGLADCWNLALVKRIGLPEPIYSLMYLDVTRDGMGEIIALCYKSLHILQHNLREVSKLCKARMKNLAENLPIEDATFHQLLAEDVSSFNTS